MKQSIIYMNKITKQLENLKLKNNLGFMTHVVVGYPDLVGTEKLVLLMDRIGIDFIELQIPFSDPLADGPTIMKACEDSLKKGTKVKDAFDLAKKLSGKISAPLLFMAYYNIVFKYGVEKFCKDSKAAGISGLIVPDLPIEENENEGFFESCAKHDLIHVQVISPASTEERLRKNAGVGSGFVYFTARQGITGAKRELDSQLIQNLKQVKKLINLPIAVGFGISKREHIDALKGNADIAIVGSAIIDIINQNPKHYLNNVEKFINQLKL